MSLDLPTCLRAQAYNNAWSNHRLLRACARLAPGELGAPATGFFGSIARTLNHILTVDWFYVSALEGDGIGPRAFEPPFPFERLEDLDREQRAVDRRLIAVCRELTAGDLDREVRMPRKDHVQHDTVGRTLLHLFQHQIHHRGQAHAMMSATSVAPPQLDEFFMAGEAHLREGDLAELGLTEAEIWGR
jgi:uncharacterized damage-inducible protein DinB